MARVVAIAPNPAVDLSIGMARLAPGAVNRAARSARTAAAGKTNNAARMSDAHGHEVHVTGLPGVANAGAFEAVAPAVEIVSTVCAGDTRLAGLLHGSLSGWADGDTLAFAASLAADAVTRIGVGCSDGADFAARRDAVTVRRLTTMPSAYSAASGGRVRNRV